MLKIKIFNSNFGVDGFSFENLLQRIKEDGLQRYIMETTYWLGISINNIDILGKIASYPFNENLKALNNLFYKVITSSDGTDNKINFMAGLGAPENYLHAVKKDDKIFLSGKKDISFVVDFAEWLELKQAVEEVIRIVQEYRNICRDVAMAITSKDVESFMNRIFVEPTWNHDPWFSLEDAWEEYNNN